MRYQGEMTKKPYKFDEEARGKYLALLSAGHGRFSAARALGVHPDTVRRFSRASSEFRESVIEAEAEAAEPVEAKLYQAALDGEPWAVKEWLSKRSKARWGQEPGAASGVTVNVLAAGDVGVSVGRLGAVTELRRQLEERAALGVGGEQESPALSGGAIEDAEVV